MPDFDVAPPQTFRVTVSNTGTVVEVPANKTILEALEAAGLDPINSCRDGICGTCESKVISGTPDHRDDLLSPAEQASNKTMLICVSRSLTDDLEIEIEE